MIVPLRHLRRTASEPFKISLPDLSSSQKPKTLEDNPRIPGYMGNVPAKNSETVHALSFARACEMSKGLREDNPTVNCDGWMRRSRWPVDPIATYNWNNRFQRADMHHLFTDPQDKTQTEQSILLGTTFGLTGIARNPYRPGDRFLHIRLEKEKESRIDPTKMKAAGQPSYSTMLDPQRWQSHNQSLHIATHQRTAY